MQHLNLPYLQPKTARGYTYYAIPKPLIDDPVFDGVDMEAKWLYCKMVERVAMSAAHAEDYTDETGKLYIIYTVEEVMADRRCSKPTAVKWIDQLDKLGLIQKRRRGQGKPTVIYVMDFASALSDTPETVLQDIVSDEDSVSKSRSKKSLLLKVNDVDFKKSKNFTSRSQENLPLEVKTFYPIKKDLREKDLKDPSYPPGEEGREEENLDELEERVKEQIEYDALLSREEYDEEQLQEVVRLIGDTLCRAGPVSMGGGEIPESAVKKRMRELTAEHVAYALDKCNAVEGVRNRRAYLLALLYNAPSSTYTDFCGKYFSQSGEGRKTECGNL